MTRDISQYSLTDMRELRRFLSTYARMVQRMGKRGRAHAKRRFFGTKNLVCTHAPGLSDDFVCEQAVQVYQKKFDLHVDPDTICLRSKAELAGGMQVFCDDQMVDLSYNRIKRRLR